MENLISVIFSIILVFLIEVSCFWDSFVTIENAWACKWDFYFCQFSINKKSKERHDDIQGDPKEEKMQQKTT